MVAAVAVAVVIGFCGSFAPRAFGFGSGTATRLLVFCSGFVVCCCAWVAADGAVAAAIDGFESTGGGGPVKDSEGPGVADISTGFPCGCGGGI